MTHTNVSVSFYKEALNITIHNLYPDLELTCPVYCSNGTTCHVPPSQQTDTDNTIEAGFGIDSERYSFKGALLYKLQRKHATGTDERSNSSTVPIKDIATNMHLLVVWDIENVQRNFCVHLVECTDDFAWDEDGLWALHDQYKHRFYRNDESDLITWLIHDGIVMKTKFDVTYGSDYKLNIIISEGTGKYNMKDPMKINPKRSVLPL
jgi:hypothetical protein